uniref:Gag-Pol polyprotein n=1 Tax=Tanacetum cinerariifolium TaxID=118510 RepID=A0A6L2JH08_TANCI|nr:Gag-Pol polyprotein [Tanacetum cinerariifolium]
MFVQHKGQRRLTSLFNTKKDRIQQTQSRAKKNKLEDHPRNVRPSLHNKKSVVNTKALSSIPNSKLNVNSDLKCGCPNCSLVSGLQMLQAYDWRPLSAHQLRTEFLGTVKFGNDHVAKIMGYGDYKIRNVTISRASKTKSWLWHRRLSHLNFDAINHLAKQGLVQGLPKLKFKKDHLCSTCAMGKSKKKSHKPKSKDTNQEKLYLLLMDLCGPMRVESVNGKKYILVIINDYSRFTWVKCLRSEDEAPDFIIKSLMMIQVRLKVPVHHVEEAIYDIKVAHMGNDSLFGVPIPEVTSALSSSTVLPHTIVQPDHQIPQHNGKWTKDHPLDNIIDQLSRPVSTRLQLYEQALFCDYDAFPTLFYRFAVNRESARDVYSKRRIIAVTELKIVEWDNYKHLDWITRWTLTDVRTALDDHLKGIRIMYLPQTIWRKSDKERAATMIQAIDKQLKTRRIMRSLERFVGGRLYEGYFRMLQRTI